MKIKYAYLLTILSLPATCLAAGEGANYGNREPISPLESMTVTAQGVLNNDDIAAEMISDANDLQSPARPTNYRATIQMGLMGRGDYTPTWWTPANQNYKSSEWWQAAAPWWLIAPLTDNKATNTRIEVGKVLSYYRSKSTGQWVQFTNIPSQWAGIYSYSNGVRSNRAVNKLVNATNGNPMYLGTAGIEYIHGGVSKLSLNPAAMDGLVNCVTARLVVDPNTGVDDTAVASYGMQMGMDWYPTVDFVISRDIPEVQYLPAAQYSKFKRLSKNWKSFCSAPLNPPGRTQSGPAEYSMPPEPVTMPLSRMSNLVIPAAPYDASVNANTNGEVTLPYGSKLAISWNAPGSQNCSLYDGVRILSSLNGESGSLTTAPLTSNKRLNLVCKNASKQVGKKPITVTVTQ